jgi:hypothetical protein
MEEDRRGGGMSDVTTDDMYKRRAIRKEGTKWRRGEGEGRRGEGRGS